MSPMLRPRLTSALALAVMLAIHAGAARGQASYPSVNDGPNPYASTLNWGKLPEGRKWGGSTGVDIDRNGNVWAIERCGANSCDKSDVAPIVQFDANGKFIKDIGAGLFVVPHNIRIDKDGNLWVTDTGVSKDGKGAQITKLSPDGKVLLKLGKAGIAATGPDTFFAPSDIAFGRNGDMFVVDSHSPNCAPSRIIKLDKNGKFIKEWGHAGTNPGDTLCPHSITTDSKGRLFVADRNNNRISIFDQDGKFLTAWTQFSRPSSIVITKGDVMYVADSETKKERSTSASGQVDYGYYPAGQRGIRVGSAKTGKVTAFIPDPAPGGGSSTAEGIGVDQHGNIYGAELGPKDLAKYSLKK